MEKIQKVEPISSILNANKNIGSNSRFAKVYCCPISTYPTCVSRPPCFLIFRWLSSLFLQLLVFLLQEISSFVLVAPCLAVMLITIQLPVVHKIPHILTFTATSGFVHINFIWLLSKSWEQGSNANTGKKHLQAYLHYKP